jgi:hypothetical protein
VARGTPLTVSDSKVTPRQRHIFARMLTLPQKSRLKSLRDPFENLAGPKNNIELEDVEGSFDCQDMFCEHTVHEAKYSPDKEVLTWRCPDGHISTIEGFSIV